MKIRPYSPADENALFDMMEEEGQEWHGIWGEAGREKYKTALRNSTTFVAVRDGVLCGFARCRNDDGFGLYVYDLLVRKSQRGQNLGRALMDAAADAFPNETVYVMSDVDPYYEKQGFVREGSIFIVRDRG